MSKSIPSPVVKRLSLYLHRLEELSTNGVDNVSSTKLADSLQLTAAQVRRDLAHFGQFGRRGVGYQVASLRQDLRKIIGTDKTWDIIIVGVGDLGRALMRYRGFQKRGFRLIAAFDIASEKIGKKIGPLEVMHLSQMPAVVKKHNVQLALLTTSAAASQKVADQLRRAEVKGILNFAPGLLPLSPGLAVEYVDIAANLEQLAFSIASED